MNLESIVVYFTEFNLKIRKNIKIVFLLLQNNENDSSYLIDFYFQHPFWILEGECQKIFAPMVLVHSHTHPFCGFFTHYK